MSYYSTRSTLDLIDLLETLQSIIEKINSICKFKQKQEWTLMIRFSSAGNIYFLFIKKKIN